MSSSRKESQDYYDSKLGAEEIKQDPDTTTQRDGWLAYLAYHQHAMDAISLSLMAFKSPH
jgi:hypothetical protein